MSDKEFNDDDYVLVSPSDSITSSPCASPGGSVLDKQVIFYHPMSRLKSSDSIDVKVPLGKRITHRTLCSTDSNFSMSSRDSLDVTPSPPLPKREPKGLLKNKSGPKKRSALSQLVSVPGDKRRPSDCLPRPPPPPPRGNRQAGAIGRKCSETDSEYDDWKSCDSTRSSVRSLDTILSARGAPPLPPRGSMGGNALDKAEQTLGDAKPLFNK